MNEQIKAQLEIINQQIKEMSAIYHSAAVKTGISDNEIWVWYALLVLDGEYSQQDICDLWSLPKQTVNSIINNMVKKGYAVLEVVPGTRNRKIIRLSDEGKEYGKNIVMRIFESEQKAFGKMTNEERKNCIEVLGKYITYLKMEIDKI